MRNTRKGFTLVELLIVVGILGALSATMSLAAKDSTPKAQAVRLANDFKLLRTAVVMYNIDSSDKGPTVAYFTEHSPDYLAGKLKNFTVSSEDTDPQWYVTCSEILSAKADEEFAKFKEDLGITESNGSYKMRVY